MSNVVYLHGQPAPIAQFLRLGSSGYRLIEQLLAAGRLPYQRFVADAGAFQRQASLISDLQRDGREVVLDTNVAQLSVIGRYQGAARGAPWADPAGVLTQAHFRVGDNASDLIGNIARFVVENGFKRVLAPAHLLPEVSSPWLSADLAACETLRGHLDRLGGRDVAIDYPLLLSNAALNDVSQRRVIVRALASVPVDSIWLRVSGFGSGATAAGVRKYISAARDFHTLGKPIVSDCVGGLAAQSILAFGAGCGVVHGIAMQEQFNTSTWDKPPKPREAHEKRGGNNYFYLLPGIDRLLKPEQAQALIGATGGRRMLSCNDPLCCANGFSDTQRDPKGHYLRQRAIQCEAISKTPEIRRVSDFVSNTLTSAGRLARQAANLRLQDRDVANLVSENAARIDRLCAVLENLQQTEADSTRSVAFPSATSIKMVRKPGRY